MIVFRYFKVLVIAGVFLTLTSCGSKSDSTDFSTTPVRVRLAQPQVSSMAGQIAVSGVIEARETAMVSTRMMGVIRNIHVDIGDHVDNGQVLFTLDAADINAKKAQVEAQILQAEAAYQNAEKDYNRYQVLFKENSATQKELENIQLQYTVAKNQWDAAKEARNEVDANLNYAQVRAPFSGTVTQKMMNTGAMANPGIPVLALEGQEGLRVSATVSESVVGHLQAGDAAEIILNAIHKKIEGQITRISPSSSYSGGQYVIEIGLPKDIQKDIKSGMYANIMITPQTFGEETDSSSIVLIPTEALIYQDELQGIYTISSNNTALLRWIRTGQSFGDYVEVLSGLNPEDNYITGAEGRLYNGAPVKIHKD